LLHYGADINATDVNNETPLFEAARYGHLDLVRVLTKNGANVDAKNDEDSVPLFEAIASKSLEVVQELLHAGADIDPCPARFKYYAEYLAQRLKLEKIRALLAGERTEERRD
jgi:ankyrin repeat protein